MYSELFRIPLHWLNAPLVGWLSAGLLLAGVVVLATIALVVRGRRSGKSAEAWGYVPGLILLGVLVAIVPRLFPDGLPIRGYGVMLLLGLLTAVGLATRRARQLGLDPELIISLAIAMVLCGVVGARLFYVIEYWETRFQTDDWPSTLVAMLKFTEGGLVVYGALIGIAVAFVWFVWRHRLPPLALADMIAPSLLAGLALGRIGCLLNGCCYGGETALPWAVTFPQESMLYHEQIASGRTLGLHLRQVGEDDPRPEVAAVDADSPADRAGISAGTKISAIENFIVQNLQHAQEALLAGALTGDPVSIKSVNGKVFDIAAPVTRARSLPVHPTQIYSSIHAALLAWVLWSFYPFRRRDGESTALMLTIYPISRFLLEIIRVDESAVFGTGLSISQNISLVLLVAAGALWIYLSHRPRRLAAVAPAPV